MKPGNAPEHGGDLELVKRLIAARKSILDQLGQVIVGQREVIDQLLMALFARGHCLIVGVPGLAKTLLVSTMAQILDLEFNRIQFTPDLMPSDITGTEVLQENVGTGRREFVFMKGPVFANILLADEINRTPPKTQSALLQAMQEYRVTVSGKTHTLSPPFFVLATQNPIEQEGTYPLPEAQLDRFFFQINIGYPSAEEEREIVRKTTSAEKFQVKKALGADEILKLQEIVRKVPAADHAVELAVRISTMTRPQSSTDGASSPAADAPDFIKKYVAWGAGPRASQTLVLAAKARAVLDGRYSVSEQDIRAVAPPVLRHRIIPNFAAEAEGVSAEDIIKKLLAAVPS